MTQQPNTVTNCPKCKGEGRTEPKEWTKWKESYLYALNDADVYNETGEQMPTLDLATLAKHDEDRTLYADEMTGPTPTTPEKTECAHCRGFGKVPTEYGKQILTLLELRNHGF